MIYKNKNYYRCKFFFSIEISRNSLIYGHRLRILGCTLVLHWSFLDGIRRRMVKWLKCTTFTVDKREYC